MAADWSLGVSFFVTLFSVLNPIHAVPLYLAMVGTPTPQTSQRVASVASLTVLIALMVALLAGEQLLALFGITIFAFQVGGGVLILMMAMSMLQGQVSPAKSTPEEAEEAAHWNSIAVVPLPSRARLGPVADAGAGDRRQQRADLRPARHVHASLSVARADRRQRHQPADGDDLGRHGRPVHGQRRDGVVAGAGALVI
jgi:hypothetical protein